LDDYLQAQDRIHRISQTKTSYVTNLMAKGTVDEWVDELLAAKQLAAKQIAVKKVPVKKVAAKKTVAKKSVAGKATTDDA